MKINGRAIGAGHAPYVIAELSANHNGDIERAFAIIDAAKAAGADALKLQTYTADTITLDSRQPQFMIQGGLWDGLSLYELYQQAHLPWDWHQPLFDYAKAQGITIFSSPFDFSAVDFLESLNVPAYKVASFELVDLPLIRYIAQTGKPMIMSTGMADEQEIQEAVEAARAGGCQDLVLLHCVSGYPAPAEQYNLATIPYLRQTFDVDVGLSDHTLDNATAIAATALGACVIEKHVTLDRSGGGPDDSFSLEPVELGNLCRDVKTAWQAVGQVNFAQTDAERGNVQFRRSLYVVKDIKKGERFTPEHIRSVRPGDGLAPKYYDQVLGQKALQDIAGLTALSHGMYDY